MRTRVAGILAAMAVTLALTARADDPPRVVVSIQPIHALVAGVMDGVGEPTLIIEGAGSPHTHALRPSQAKALQEAGLVVWVGESIETFLIGSIDTLAPNARIVELMEAPGVTVLAFREGTAWEGDVHGARGDETEHAEDHDAHDDHGHGEVDGHIWLDPDNAKAIVASVVSALTELDPEHAAAYRSNGERLAADIDSLAADISGRLAPVADRSYVVFHDAYQYFENAFGVRAVGSVTLSPDRQPGAARIADIRRRLHDEAIVCVFREPQFSPRIINTIVEGTEVKVGVIDPLGADLQPGPELYGTLMTAIADGLFDCLVGT